VDSLSEVLGSFERLAVLLSGGVDSEVLLRAAVRRLGPGSVLALTADTCFQAEHYRKMIPVVCSGLGVELARVKYDPLTSSDIVKNGSDRCYHCKKAVYSHLRMEAYRRGFPVIADGTNLDDLDEHRPGLLAASEENVLHPFVAACMGKNDIRNLSESLGMADPGRPSDSCLATRISEELELSQERLLLIEKLEAPLRPHVRGRLRVRLGSKGITLEYEEIDAGLVLEAARMWDIPFATASPGERPET
jgi:uncharacterized protein